MKKTIIILLTATIGGFIPGCRVNQTAVHEKDPVHPKERIAMQAEVKQFLGEYQHAFAELEKKQTLAYWTAANSGTRSIQIN